ncbi:MAG TPA: [Fe-Fe] hydrogenase large subunit C-terminal domain-containing protein [Candidatus Kapabacteria bacterium]|nr:[Fe-Fe] hydrogenase large subunit C-terminal domain-containing protein [Candidatus Kapabacteria bacterium]
MYNKYTKPLIQTIKERCRVCYTCVRECPVKAIKIIGGQAEVEVGKCIGCGNCVKVCRQEAKQYLSSINEVTNLLKSNQKVSACIAPSYPADFFHIIDYKTFVGMIRKLGFNYVHEVAFGADIVAKKTIELIDNKGKKRYISTSCPAVCELIRCYYPELLDNLAPVVSPMIAMARIVKEQYGEDTKIVFIGPCIAKKGEAGLKEVRGEVDEVLTFQELKQLFDINNITPENVKPTDFDPPFGGKGALFPLSRGMHQSVNIYEDLMDGNIVAAEGREGVIDAIKEFATGDIDAKMLELLCCQGCIMGPGMNSKEPPFRRRSRISRYVRNIMKKRDAVLFKYDIEKFDNLDYSRTFSVDDQRLTNPKKMEINKVLLEIGKDSSKDELNCGACGYETCREFARAVCFGLAEKEMCLPYTIEMLHKTVKDLENSNLQLESTKEALRQSEKLASMGQLAAGIAHELNNPLGVVLMYSHLLLEETDEANTHSDDLKIIVDEANRCKNIVSGLLNFSRKNKLNIANTNVYEMVNNYLKIHKIPDDVTVSIEKNIEDCNAEIDKDQIIQVVNNLIGNAMEAMENGGTLTVKIDGDKKNVSIIVTDTGIGIPKSNLSKIFEPFFTTKQIGKGTGLGLAVSYGIIKMHKGKIEVTSNADAKVGQTGTTFNIILPRKSEVA